MYLSLIAIVSSTPISSDLLGLVAALLSYFFLSVAGWRMFKKNDGKVDSDSSSSANSQAADSNGDSEVIDSSRSIEVPKPKSRSKRWRSSPADENSTSDSGGNDAIKLEKKKVANLTVRMQQTEAELKSLKQELGSPESNAKFRQVLLEKNKAIAERNKAQGKLQKYKNKVAELERGVAEESSTEVGLQTENDSSEKFDLELLDRLATLESDNAKLAGRLEESQHLASQAEKENGRTTKRRDFLENQLTESQSDSDELCHKIDQLQKDLVAAESLAMSWQNAASENELTEKHSQEKLGSIQQTLNDSQVETERLEERIEQLESELDAAQTKASTLESKHESVLEERTNLAADKEKSLADVDHYQNQLQSSQSELEKLAAALDSQRAESASVLQELSQLQAEIEDLKTQNKKAERRTGNLVRDLDIAAQSNIEWEAKFGTLEKLQRRDLQKLTSMEHRTSELKITAEEFEVEKCELIAALEKQLAFCDELEALGRESEAQAKLILEETIADRAARNDRLAELENGKTQLQTTIEELQQKVTLSEREQAKQTQDLLEEQNRLIELIVQRDRDLEIAHAESGGLSVQLKKLSPRAEQAILLEQQLEQLQGEYSSLQVQLSKTNERLVASQAESDLTVSPDEVERLENEIGNLQTEKTRLTSELVLASDGQRSGSEELESLRARLEQYQDEVYKRDAEIESLQNVEAHSSRLSKEMQELGLERDSLNQRLVELTSVKNQLQLQVAGLERSGPRGEEEFQALQTERDQFKSGRKKVTRKYRQLHERFATMQSDFSIAQRDNAQLEQQLLHAQKQNDLLAQQVALLETNLASLGSGAEPNGPDLQRLHTVIGQLGERLAVSHEKYKKLAIQYRKTRSRYKRYKDRMVSYKNLLERYRETSEGVPQMSDSSETIAVDLAERSP